MSISQEQLLSYDTYLVAFSGGKDSLAALLHLLESGVDKSKIELMHHVIDGREGSTLMDWRCTDSYCKAVADAFDIPIYYSWRVGGFEREMCKENDIIAPVKFECPDGTIAQAGGLKGKVATRRMFPQQAADLKTRWCSSVLKIQVCEMAIRNQKRFEGQRTLVLTGERGEESTQRSKYAQFETHKADARTGKGRHVDHWRPVLNWTEQQVWDIIKFWKVNPHPAYQMGFGRVSCAGCIFGDANQWASLLKINPEQVHAIAAHEDDFGKTISTKKISVLEQAAKGKPYAAINRFRSELASSETYDDYIITPNWSLPAGAFTKGCGSL